MLFYIKNNQSQTHDLLLNRQWSSWSSCAETCAPCYQSWPLKMLSDRWNHRRCVPEVWRLPWQVATRRDALPKSSLLCTRCIRSPGDDEKRCFFALARNSDKRIAD